MVVIIQNGVKQSGFGLFGCICEERILREVYYFVYCEFFMCQGEINFFFVDCVYCYFNFFGRDIWIVIQIVKGVNIKL